MADISDRLRRQPEAEAERLGHISEEEAQEYLHRGMRERWLSQVVHCLNWLERQPGTRALAQRALRRLGFPISP
jgi:hypothetical protein